jgi:hypothetical protein
MSSQKRGRSGRSNASTAPVDAIEDRYDYNTWVTMSNAMKNPFQLRMLASEAQAATTEWALLHETSQRTSWFSARALQFLHEQLKQLQGGRVYYIRTFMLMRKVRADAQTQIRLKYELDLESGFTGTQIQQGFHDNETKKIVWRVAITDTDGKYTSQMYIILHKDFSDDKSSLILKSTNLLIELYHPQIREMVKWPVASSLQQQLIEGIERMLGRPCVVGFLTCHNPPKELVRGMFPFLDEMSSVSRPSATFYFLWNLYLACERLHSSFTLSDVILTLSAWYTIDADVRRKYYVRFVLCLQSFIQACNQLQ